MKSEHVINEAYINKKTADKNLIFSSPTSSS